MAQVNGTEAGEYLAGTDNDDVIYGFGGADQISAFYGNDLIYPGAGKDYVQADVGDDTIILADPLEYLDFFPMRVYEEFYGGGGFDTIEMRPFDNNGLNVTTPYGQTSTYALSSAFAFQGIERLTFASSVDVAVFASIQHSQVTNAGVTHLVGGAGRDILSIVATYNGAFDMPNFTVTGFQAAPVDISSGDAVFLSGMAGSFYTLTAREGLGATQVLAGAEGNDTLNGSSAADMLAGNAGNDLLVGNGGADRMLGGLGDDIYVAGTGTTIVESAGQGNDRVVAISSLALAADADIETLETSSYTGTTAIDLTGSSIANTILGNNGANVFDGGAGDDTIHGFAGNDYLYGSTGVDNMYGGAGDDHFYMAFNDGDRVWEFAGEGYDVVSTEVDYTLPDVSGVERLEAGTLTATTALYLGGSNLDNLIIGNAGNNTLRGFAGADTLHGLGGDDALIGDEGADVMYGGTGNDTYYVGTSDDRIFENAGEGTADRAAVEVSYALPDESEIETLEAVNSGATAAMDLTGSSYANLIVGNAGANVIDGKGGNDVLVGLGGADTFAFTTALGAGNVDRIEGFVAGTDHIALDDAVFAALAPGALAAGAFVTGAAAGDADDRVVYDSAAGTLSYDADGNGAGAAIVFATLGTGLGLTAADFLVI